jgi:hypothetical protein
MLLKQLHFLFKYSPVFFKDLFWGLYFSICLLTAYLMQLTILGIYILDITTIYNAINSPKTIIDYIPILIPYEVEASLIV